MLAVHYTVTTQQIFHSLTFLPYDGTNQALLNLNQKPNTNTKETTISLCESRVHNTLKLHRILQTFIVLPQEQRT